MTKKTLMRMAGLLCISLVLAGCSKEPEVVEVVRAIKSMTVAEDAAQQTLKLSGIVAAVDSSDLSFQVGGQVLSVEVDIGDPVTKGMVLATLDPEPFQLEVNATKEELVKTEDNVIKAKAEFERQQRIFEQGAGAKRYLDVAEYNYKAATSAVKSQRAKLNLANRNLRKTKLHSPFDGTIALRSVQPHEDVQMGQKIFEINATGKLEVEIAVPETNIEQIGIGESATLVFQTLPGESAKGLISYIGSAAVQANAFPVKVELIDPDKKLRPGMTAEVSIILRFETQEPGYPVPLQAILPAPDKNRGYAFVYDPQTSTVKKTPVHLHSAKEKLVIVDEGLGTGDIIAIAGVSFLADGMTVKLMNK